MWTRLGSSLNKCEQQFSNLPASPFWVRGTSPVKVNNTLEKVTVCIHVFIHQLVLLLRTINTEDFLSDIKTNDAVWMNSETSSSSQSSNMFSRYTLFRHNYQFLVYPSEAIAGWYMWTVTVSEAQYEGRQSYLASNHRSLSSEHTHLRPLLMTSWMTT